MSSVLAALLRAAPLALALPLPGLVPRAALALVLALCADSVAATAWEVELARGLALGAAVGAPVWAARWAGRLIGAATARRGSPLWADASGLLAWLVFGSVGGWTHLLSAYLSSYRVWSGDLITVAAGAAWLKLAVELALPALLALALTELCAGLVARFEDAAQAYPGAPVVARASRPLVALLLFVAGLASFVQGVAHRVLR